MEKMDIEYGNLDIEKLEISISNLIYTNVKLEYRFNRVANFSVWVMYLVCTTLNIMQCNKEVMDNGKVMETTCSLYIFLFDDYF